MGERPDLQNGRLVMLHPISPPSMYLHPLQHEFERDWTDTRAHAYTNPMLLNPFVQSEQVYTRGEGWGNGTKTL